MSKDLSKSFRFNISSDEQFYELAGAFSHALKAVEQQGYAVDFHGKTLHHPGQIGVKGQSGIGKSTFFNAAMAAFGSENVQIAEKTQPSADLTRNVLVWKQWLFAQEEREIKIEDLHAEAALAHMPEMRPPEREWAGVSIFEHIDENGNFCDMMIKMDYDEEGGRFAEIHTTESVAQSPDFSAGFLPLVRDITL